VTAVTDMYISEHHLLRNVVFDSWNNVASQCQQSGLRRVDFLARQNFCSEANRRLDNILPNIHWPRPDCGPNTSKAPKHETGPWQSSNGLPGKARGRGN